MKRDPSLKLRIIFAATPQLACPSLEALHRQEAVELCAVLSQPDQAVGRKHSLQPSPIKARAQDLGIACILTPGKLDTTLRKQVAELQPDLLVVFAYGKIFRQRFLDLFPLGAINLHPSALPQWRGPSPIESQLRSGSTQLGITVQRISLAMDAGDILEQQSFSLSPESDYFEAAQIASQQGAQMLYQACAQLAAEREDYLDRARPQDTSQATYCSLICKEDGYLNWESGALALSRQCRAYAAWPKGQTWLTLAPGAPVQQLNILSARPWIPTRQELATLQSFALHCRAKPGSLLAVHPRDGLLVQCGQEILTVQHLQRQSKKPCSAQEFANQLPKLVQAESVHQEKRAGLPRWSQLPELLTDQQIPILFCFQYSSPNPS